jgi:hypothetical protein
MLLKAPWNCARVSRGERGSEFPDLAAPLRQFPLIAPARLQ